MTINPSKRSFRIHWILRILYKLHIESIVQDIDKCSLHIESIVQVIDKMQGFVENCIDLSDKFDILLFFHDSHFNESIQINQKVSNSQ